MGLSGLKCILPLPSPQPLVPLTWVLTLMWTFPRKKHVIRSRPHTSRISLHSRHMNTVLRYLSELHLRGQDVLFKNMSHLSSLINYKWELVWLGFSILFSRQGAKNSVPANRLCKTNCYWHYVIWMFNNVLPFFKIWSLGYQEVLNEAVGRQFGCFCFQILTHSKIIFSNLIDFQEPTYSIK